MHFGLPLLLAVLGGVVAGASTKSSEASHGSTAADFASASTVARAAKTRVGVEEKGPARDLAYESVLAVAQVPGSVPGAPEEEFWYVVRMQGSPVGIARESWRTDDEGCYYRHYMKLQLARGGVSVQLILDVEELDAPDGRVKWFRTETKASDTAVRTSGEARGDTIYLLEESLGFSERKKIPWENGALGAGTAEPHIQERLRGGESEFSIRVFDPEIADFQSIRIRRNETVWDSTTSGPREYLRIEQYHGESDVPMCITLLDEHFRPAKILMQQMSIWIEFERVSGEAIEAIELEPDFDVIRASTISCPGYPDGLGRLRDVTLRFTFAHSSAAQRMQDGPNQKVIRREGNTLELLITRETICESSLSEDEQQVFLAPDRYIQSNAPELKDAAGRIAAASGKEGLDLAREIAAWVKKHIEKKDLEQGFASALEVFRSQRGDCTEHALLLAALLRAAGLPARVVAGLAYGNGRLFGHMWTETYVDCWRTLDAVDLNNDPIRVRISVSPDASALGKRDLVNAYTLLGGLKAEVLDYRLMEAE